MDYIKAGKITHYFDKIGVAVMDVTDVTLQVGDTIRVGEEADGFEQKIDSMQVNHEQVEVAKAGDEVGLKVSQPTKEKDVVYKVVE